MLIGNNIQKIANEEKSIYKRFLQFLDGPEYDQVLTLILKGLFFGMILFCLPFLIYLVVISIF